MQGNYELPNALSNGTVHDTLLPPLPEIGRLQPPPKTEIAIISGTGKATNFKFGRYVFRVHPNKSPLKLFEKRECGRIQELPNSLGTPMTDFRKG